MAQNIQITTQLNLDDSQFKSGVNGVETILKKLSTTNAFVKLKLDESDFRKQYQSIVRDAIAAIRKAYGAKKGEDITYRNAKGNATKIDTIGSMRTAYTYALGQSVNDKLTASDQAMWKRRSDALAIYLNVLKQIGQETRNVARAQKEIAEMPFRKERARRSAEVYIEKRRAIKSELAPELEEKEADKLFRREAMAKMAEQERQVLEAKRAAEKEAREIEKRKTDALRKQAKEREKIRRQEAATARGIKATDAATNRLLNGGNSNATLANMRTYYREQERQAKNASDAQNRLIRQYQTQYGILGGLKSRLASYFSIYAIANFGKKIAETTGYFEKQQVALEGILGSASKAQDVLSQIKDFALHSPFQTKELVTFTKQLAAFSIPSDQLFETTKRLADLSAGLGVDMSRIILAYGQVRSAAVLRGQELRQFTEAGIPLVQKLAEKFTKLRGEVVTTADVFELISKRQVSFQMVSDVLSDMTKEGGQFYKMQENITDTLYGQIQKLQDMWTLAMDDMGKNSGGFFMKVVKLLQLIVKNASGVTAALLSAFTLSWAIRNVRRMRMEWELLSVDMKRSIGSLRAFQTMRLKQFAGNLGWGIAAAGVGLAVGAIYNHYRKLHEVERKMNEIADSFNKETNKMIGGFDDLVRRLRSAKSGTQEYNDAVATLKSNYGEFVNVNEKTIQTLLSEQEAVAGATSEYERLREQIAAAIKLKQQLDELETKNKSAGEIVKGNAEGSAWWGTGYKAINDAAVTLFGNLLASGKSVGEKGKALNELFGTHYEDSSAAEKILKDLNDVANQAHNDFVNQKLPINFSEMSQDEQDKYLREKFQDIYSKSFNNKFLSNKLEESTIEAINQWIGNVGKSFYGKMVESDGYEEWLDSAKRLTGAGNDLLAMIIRINNVFDEYMAGGNTGTSVVGKQQWTNREYAKLLERNVKDEFDLLGGDTTKLKNLEEVISNFVSADTYDEDGVRKITTALDEFFNTITDPERREVVASAMKRFKEGTDVLTEQEAKLANRMELDSTWAGINRGTIKNVDLQNFIDTYNPAGLGEQTLEQTRDKIRSAYDDLRKKLKTYTTNAVLFRDDIALVNAQMRILERLAKNDLYAVELTEKKGGGSGGGWRRMFSDLFSYIKEARAEEKKLIEHSAGLTGELYYQINSEQLKGTAVNAFWSEGSPFKKFIDKMDEYGIESEVFSKDFLKGALSNMVTEFIDNGDKIDTVDFEQMWGQLIQVIKGRIDELSLNPNMKSTVDSLKAYLTQMVMEGEKYFSRDKVEALIKEQLNQIKRINASVEALRDKNTSFEGISEASNYLRAQNALYGGGRYRRFDDVSVTSNQLRRLLNQEAGRGIALTAPGEALSAILEEGKLNIDKLKELLHIRERLLAEAAQLTVNDMQGEKDIQRQAAFEEFKGIISNFDGLIKKLTDDMLNEYKGLMDLNDSVTKKANGFVNAAKKYSDAMDLINKSLVNGNIKSPEADKMRLNALQDVFGSVASELSEYIRRFFGDSNSATGISKKGFNFWNTFGGKSLQSIVQDNIGKEMTESLAAFKEKLTEQLKKGELTQEKYGDKLAKGSEKIAGEYAGAMADFAGGVGIADMIIKTIYAIINALLEMGEEIIQTLEAVNHGLHLSRNENGSYIDENGNIQVNEKYYDDENRWQTDRQAFEVVGTYNQHVMDGWEKTKSGDGIGAFMEIFTSITDLIQGIANIGDTEIRQHQEELIRSNEKLERALNNLSHVLQGEAGTERWRIMTEQIANLEEQEKNMLGALDDENNAKHGDVDKAQEFADAATKARQEIDNIRRAVQEEIFGTADELSSQLTDAFVEAFKNGENAARNWRDTVRGYISDVLKDVLLSKVLSPKLDKLIDDFLGGETDPDEILKKFSDPAKATGLRDSMFLLGDYMVDYWNALPEDIREMIAWNSDTSDLSGGIQGITEDTARTLEGLSNSMLAQLVLIQRSAMNMESFANVQVSHFKTLLEIQNDIKSYTMDIRDMLNAASVTGVTPLKVDVVK